MDSTFSVSTVSTHLFFSHSAFIRTPPDELMPHPKYSSTKHNRYQPPGTFRGDRGGRGGASGFRDPVAAATQGGALAPTLGAPFSSSFRSGSPSHTPRAHPYAPRTEPAAFEPRSTAEERRYRAEEPAEKMTSVSTWTVQIGEVPISYISRMKWSDQARPEKGTPPGSVLEPFRGYTLQDRHPNEPKATYTEEELRHLCPTCGTLVIHWDTHKQGQLHHDRVKASKRNAETAGPTQQDVVAALRILQATRPDIIAASLAATAPGLVMAQGGTHPHSGAGAPRERSNRRSRSPSPNGQRRSSKWDQPCDDAHYEDAVRAASRAAAATTRQIFGESSRAPMQDFAPHSYTWR